MVKQILVGTFSDKSVNRSYNETTKTKSLCANQCLSLKQHFIWKNKYLHNYTVPLIITGDVAVAEDSGRTLLLSHLHFFIIFLGVLAFIGITILIYNVLQYMWPFVRCCCCRLPLFVAAPLLLITAKLLLLLLRAARAAPLQGLPLAAPRCCCRSWAGQ